VPLGRLVSLLKEQAMGGKPNPGTPKDKRLKENKAAPSKSAKISAKPMRK
jgi:hypothetical protein